MDHVDQWLNRQYGWRQGLLIWLHLSPAFVVIGLAWHGSFGPGPGPTRAVLLIMGLCVVAAIPVAVAVLAIRRIWQRRIKPKPAFSWRASVALLLLMISSTVEMLPGEVAGWRHLHRVADLTALLLLGAGLAMLVVLLRYQRRSVC